ncbi:MAG: amidohydrolase family protein [Thermoanaerobaculia bacterium]
MRSRLIASLVVALCLAAHARAQLAIAHVTVIDTTGGPSRRDATVVIRDGRIASIGDTVPKGSEVVDGRGKFLIPGLWDMHAHLSWSKESALHVLVANGVTGVRDLGGRLTEIDAWRTRIATGSLVGPRIFRAGPILNGKKFNQYQMVPGNPDETRGVVRGLKEAGVDFIKVHRRMERDSYFAAIDEAKKQGLPLVGHIPMSVSPEEASDAGQATIEHVVTLFEGTFASALNGRKATDAMRQWCVEEGDKLAARFVRNHTVFDPTLIAYSPYFDSSGPLGRYVARDFRTEAAKQPKPTPAELEGSRALFAVLEEVVRVMNKGGVTMLTGSDLAESRVPGFMLQQELVLLVESGLTPLQALQAATLNPARVLKISDDFGSVDAGKIADLVLLDADPLVDIHNTQRIAAVILGGKRLKRADLDALLRKAEEMAKNE